MKKIQLFLFILCYFNPLFANQNEYIHGKLLSNGYGMFSVVFYVMGLMQEYEINNYAGVNIDFEKTGPYYDEEYGPNWWNYYFEPINFQSTELKKVDQTTNQHYYAISILSGDKHENNVLINKYIHVKKHILEKVDRFVIENFHSKHMIGIHYRGTDKTTEAPSVKYSRVVRTIKKYIKRKHWKNYLIFLATDEQKFVDYLEEQFPEKILSYNCQRSNDSNPIHLYGQSKYMLGEEAIIDSLLLSKCDVLIRTSSNLSLFSTFLNVELPVFELNQPYQEVFATPIFQRQSE